MIYLRFDNEGNQLDITNDEEYRLISTENDWVSTGDYIFDDIDFNQKEFKLVEGTITLIDKEDEDSGHAPKDRDLSTFDEEGRRISLNLYFEGGGVNSSRVSGWTRRFNGMSMTNRTGMMFKHGAVLEFLEFTDSNNSSNKKVQIYHYNSSGGDGVKVYEKDVNEENNNFLYEDNLHIYIPPFRRVAIYLTGNTFSYPQYRLGYRRIFE